MTKVFTNGCFDVIHRGHIEILKYCKELGTVIVGLNSDESVKRLKGTGRPFFSQEDREVVLRACKYVDDVVVFDEDTPYQVIQKTMPDIIVKGGDYKIEDVVGNDLATVKIFKYLDGYSTSNIIGDKK